MGSPIIDLFGKAHMKVGFIPVILMYALPILESLDLNYRICRYNVSTLQLCFAMTRLHERNSSGFVLHAVSIDDSSMVIGND